MPLYEYRCANCGETCELLQKVSEAPAVTCPHCGKDQLKRQISATRFQLKGTGWYVTDFKNKEPTAKTDSKSESSPPSSEENKTQKPETKTEKEKES